jgi:hypothetical protein
MRWTIRIAFFVVLLIVLLSCLGLWVPGDLLFAILFGWVFYLGRVIPQARVNPNGVATALICLAGFAVGLHLFLCSLARQSRESQGGKPLEHDAGPDEVPRESWPLRWSAAAVGITLLMFVTGMAAAGLAHQLGWLITGTSPFLAGDGGARTAARRAQSTNNLKQMGVAFDAYHEGEGHFPAGCTTDAEGEILHSWMASLLPFLEQQSLFDRIDFALPWDHPVNQAVFREKVFGFLNPAVPETAERDRDGYWLSHYAGNVHVVGGSRPMTRGQIKDGTSQTILAGEVADRFLPWGKPGNWRDPALGINRSPGGFGSPFPGGSNLMFMDGSVRFVKNSIDPRILRALGTPDGGEAVNPESY